MLIIENIKRNEHSLYFKLFNFFLWIQENSEAALQEMFYESMNRGKITHE